MYILRYCSGLTHFKLGTGKLITTTYMISSRVFAYYIICARTRVTYRKCRKKPVHEFKTIFVGRRRVLTCKHNMPRKAVKSASILYSKAFANKNTFVQ